MTGRDTYAELQQAQADLRASLTPRPDIKPMPMIEPTPSPSRTSHLVARLVLGMVVGGLVLVMCTAARAAEPERIWTVVDATTGKPWTSPKGNQATATNPTACDLALVEASTRAPAGSRLQCKRISQ